MGESDEVTDEGETEGEAVNGKGEEKGAGEEGESVSRASLHYISVSKSHRSVRLCRIWIFFPYLDIRLLSSDRSNFDQEP